MKLKRLDSNTYTVRDFYKLLGCPWQVCTIDNGLVAVTLESEECVHLISLEGFMKTKRKVNTDFKCYCLAYANNNLYISDHNTSVYIYTLYGQKLRQFSKDQSGKALFSNIYSLAVCKNATRIYVADAYDGMTVLNENGNVISRYNGRKLRRARCCYFTETSETMSVLVSGAYSNNVVQFTSNGDLMGEVVTTREIHGEVRAVWCNKQRSELCISRYKEDNIVVYDILPA